jgi:DNA-binding response OmpR family regulator
MFNFEELYQQTKNLSILFVEDYAPLREKIIEILEDFFTVVEDAQDGEEGLKKYKEYRKSHGRAFDIVITDIKMPKRDGISLARAILEINEEQIIVVLSAHQETDYLMQLINMGIAQFIPKPVEPEKLLEVISLVSKKIKNVKTEPLKSDTVTLDNNLIWDKKLLSLIDGQYSIELTKNERHVMKLLVNNIESICSMESIISYFDAENINISSEGVRNMMSRLRKKMPENVITNIYGLGYKLSNQK